MLRYRAVDIHHDRDTLLEFHCRINYASETPWARAVPYERYREKWLSTSQPESFISHLAETMKDEGTVVEILEDDGTAVGYIWMTFTNVPDYDVTIAEVEDIIVVADHRRRGIGLEVLAHMEGIARDRGATVLRSDTGIENVVAQRLHEKFGFKPYRIHYEKLLRKPPDIAEGIK
jgi:GNAT superfamily N-acetyltransferase